PNTATQPRWNNVIGNPRLRSEKANTVTAGIVADIGENITLSVDYWRIEISDMITAEDVDVNLWQACMSPVTNPTFDPAHPACARITRDPVDGGNAPTFGSFTNSG